MTTTPTRVQRQRTKGSKLPKDCVYVGRPGMWGNIFQPGERYLWITGLPYPLPTDDPGGDRATLVRVETCPDIQTAVDWYRARMLHHRSLSEEARLKLAGKDLACWCRLDQPCHADVLLEVANQGQQ